jgi:hypothetical protein
MMLKLSTENDITAATKGLAALTIVQIEFMKVPLPEILAAEPSKSVGGIRKLSTLEDLA